MSVKAILGTKIGMTQIFTDEGTVVPVTVISAGPCTVISKGEKNVQVGYREIRPEAVKRLLNRPERMAFEKAGVKPFRYVRSLPADELDSIETQSEINVAMFKEGDKVSVTGTSKGKGFSGVMRRHNFAGQQITHGQTDRSRAVGSIGTATDMARVIKGKKMPGQYGNVKRTVRGLQVVKVDEEKNLLLVRGSIPGAKNGLVVIKHQA
ncbi:MAG: 50S ribosomal protein L3 [Candidatus Riflebacteria bacterium]|nr:50S ribosomal protein L3 [Candidatus Riflebacteria bacterium]